MSHAMRVFFIIGTSGSMAGSKIGAVNMVMREMLPEITDISDASGVKIKIAVLAFSSGALQYADDSPAREEPEDEMEW